MSIGTRYKVVIHSGGKAQVASVATQAQADDLIGYAETLTLPPTTIVVTRLPDRYREFWANFSTGEKTDPDRIKMLHFEKVFPHRLENNEFKVRWKMKHRDGKTYNPDYHCPALDCYVELVTSAPNISQFGHKWQKALRLGFPLRLFWWEGEEITDSIRQYASWPVPRHCRYY